jgi:hypothetical protein
VSRPEDQAPHRPAETPEERRARLAKVFGDVLPDTTQDERDTDVRRERDADQWLRDQVPPHHGS